MFLALYQETYLSVSLQKRSIYSKYLTFITSVILVRYNADRPQETARQPWCTHVSFIEDGEVAMDERQLMQFTGRLSLAFMNYMLRQHSKHLDLRIDCDQVLQAITFMHKGKRVSLAPWSNCPGWRPTDSEVPDDEFPEYMGRELMPQEDIRLEAWGRWMAYATKTAQHIPRVVAKGQVPSQDDKHKTPDSNNNKESVEHFNDHCE
jgi:hypothetical protein